MIEGLLNFARVIEDLLSFAEEERRPRPRASSLEGPGVA
jgi:hypothetical protein